MVRVLIFDFDGTIVDSKTAYIDTIHRSLLKRSFIYPKERIAKALGPKIETTLKNLNKFSHKMLKSLKNEINKNITKKVKELKLCPYVKETLRRLKQKKFKIILLTNSARKFVITFLKYNKIMKYFNRLFYAENFKSKEEAIRNIAKKYNISIRKIVYIADKKKDVEIAKKIGCKIIIVLICSWDKKEFHKEKYTINSMKQLEKMLLELNI
ncbi:MAG: HAD-IA family hydrolase [Candidatus Pacearchaeota archaeon]